MSWAQVSTPQYSPEVSTGLGLRLANSESLSVPLYFAKHRLLSLFAAFWLMKTQTTKMNKRKRYQSLLNPTSTNTPLRYF